MRSQEQYKAALSRLRAAGATIRCRDLAAELQSLGFEVRDGRKPGHKVFVHHGVPNFSAGSYTCGHGRNPEIKPVYVKKVLKLLKQYESELIHHLETQP